jgi:hypothetical protein
VATTPNTQSRVIGAINCQDGFRESNGSNNNKVSSLYPVTFTSRAGLLTSLSPRTESVRCHIRYEPGQRPNIPSVRAIFPSPKLLNVPALDGTSRLSNITFKDQIIALQIWDIDAVVDVGVMDCP